MVGVTNPSDTILVVLFILVSLNVLAFAIKLYIFIRQCVLDNEFYEKYRLINPLGEPTALFQPRIILPLILHDNIYKCINYFYIVRYRPRHLPMSNFTFFRVPLDFALTFLPLAYDIVNRILIIRQEKHIAIQTEKIIRWRLTVLRITQMTIAPLGRFVGNTISIDDEIEKLGEALSELKKEHSAIHRKKRSQIGFFPLVLFLVLLTFYSTIYIFQVVVVNLSALVERGTPPVSYCENAVFRSFNSTYCNTYKDYLDNSVMTSFLGPVELSYKIWPSKLVLTRPIYFYPIAADCIMLCHINYFCNFGRLNVAGGKNDHIRPNTEI